MGKDYQSTIVVKSCAASCDVVERSGSVGEGTESDAGKRWRLHITGDRKMK